jgi:hypothetical protein
LEFKFYLRIFSAIGKSKEGILISLSRQSFLQLPLIVVLSLLFGIMLAGDGLVGILLIVVVRKEMIKRL